jgi:hypothetical protein
MHVRAQFKWSALLQGCRNYVFSYDNSKLYRVYEFKVFSSATVRQLVVIEPHIPPRTISCYTAVRTKRNVEKYNPQTLKENGARKCVKTRETREGRPLITVETGVNGYSKSTIESGPSLVGLLGL